MKTMPTTPISVFVGGMPRVIQLPVDEAAVPAAREFVRHQAEDWGLANSEDIALVASELVENAILHARADIHLAIGHRADCVVLQVEDDNDTLPDPYPADALDDRGRGLALVEAIADRWGTTPLTHGKRVWAEVPLTR